MAIRVDVHDRYKHCSDAELRKLAEGYNDLTLEAQQALLSELNARGLRDGVETAHQVHVKAEAEAIAAACGPDYFVVTEADERMPGWFQVITPHSDLFFPHFCPGCGSATDATFPVVDVQFSKTSVFAPVHAQQLQYKVPHCHSCRQANIRAGVPLALTFLGAAVAFTALIYLWLGLRGAMLAMLLGLFLGRNRIKAFARQRAPGGVFILEHDSNSVWFVIKDRNYAENFCALNRAGGTTMRAAV